MIQNNLSTDNVLWGLKENGWKEVYNRQLVRELRGLDKDIEPQFYNSIKNAKEYAFQQIGQALTMECYKRIHQLACSYFLDLDPAELSIDKKNIDDFRNSYDGWLKNIVTYTPTHENAEQSEKRKSEFLLLHAIRWELFGKDKIIPETGCKKELDELLSPEIKDRLIKRWSEHAINRGIDIKEFFENGVPAYEQAFASKEKIKEQLQAIQKKLNLEKPFAELDIKMRGDEPFFHIYYRYKNPEEIEKAIHAIIDDYNEKSKILPSNVGERTTEENELALKYIAELFQSLEWLCPFMVGQGCTDLVLLAKLLTENGFNPPNLYDPYFSTFEPLEKWISYLKDGIESRNRN